MSYLIIEDNPSDVEFVSLILKAETGLEVEICQQEEAFEKIEGKPAFIQLDGLEGACFGLLDRLKERHPDGIYLVYSSHCSHLDFSAEIMRRGAKCFMKGYHDELVEYVQGEMKKTR